MHLAEIIQSEEGQSVRLPPEFRFTTNEVFIRRDEATGDVVLSAPAVPKTNWKEIFAMLDTLEIPDHLWRPEDRDTSQPPDRVNF